MLITIMMIIIMIVVAVVVVSMNESRINCVCTPTSSIMFRLSRNPLSFPRDNKCVYRQVAACLRTADDQQNQHQTLWWQINEFFLSLHVIWWDCERSEEIPEIYLIRKIIYEGGAKKSPSSASILMWMCRHTLITSIPFFVVCLVASQQKRQNVLHTVALVCCAHNTCLIIMDTHTSEFVLYKIHYYRNTESIL